MPSITDAIYFTLKSDATLLGLIGGDASDPAIYPERASQRAQGPYIVYETQSEVPHYHLTGETNVSTLRFVFYCVAPSNRTARQIAERIRTLLSGTRGLIGETGAQVFVQRAHIVNRDSDADSDGDNDGIRMIERLEFEIGFEH